MSTSSNALDGRVPYTSTTTPLLCGLVVGVLRAWRVEEEWPAHGWMAEVTAWPWEVNIMGGVPACKVSLNTAWGEVSVGADGKK